MQASKSSQDGAYVGGATTMQSGPANPRSPKTYILDLNERNYPLKNANRADYMQGVGILYPGDKLQIIAETDTNPGGDGDHGLPGKILMNDKKEWLDLKKGKKTGPLRVTDSVSLGALVPKNYVTEITVEDTPVLFNYSGSGNAYTSKYAVLYDREAGVHGDSYWQASTMVWVGVPKYHPVVYTFENNAGAYPSEDITNLPDKVYAGDNPTVIYAEDLSCNYNPIDGETVIGPIFTIHHPKIKGYRFQDVDFISKTKADRNYSPKCLDFSADRMTSQWRFFFDGADDYNGAFENKIKGSEEDPIKIHFKYQEARTVSLNGNGGTVDNVKESILVYRYRIDRGSTWHEDDGRYGYAFTFSKHIPVRSGYEFTGWYADKACTKLVIAASSGNMDSDFKKYINANNIFQKEGSENCSENFDMYAGWKKAGATPTPTPKPTATPTPKPTATPTPKPASGFSDVQNPAHPYYNAIYWAANAGITKGYPDGTFGINKNCTRGEMMMFLWRYAGKQEPKSVSKSPFKDVPKTHAFYKAILWGSQKGITKGYSDGTFGVNRNVTRGECMMFLWRLKGKPAPKAVAKAPFPDVPKNHVFYNAVLWGFQKKITTGFKEGKLKGQFGVNENCTRGQIVTFLYRAR